ncbi:MAG: hypothetical protein AAGH74_06055 [Pseudomonadota bacterium]
MRLTSFLVLICTALAISPASAKPITAPLRLVYTDITAHKIVEDCRVCAKPGKIYFITTMFKFKYVDPESVSVQIQRSREFAFLSKAKSSWPFGKYAFSKSKNDPAALLQDIEFAEEGKQPMLFGVFTVMVERNPPSDAQPVFDLGLEMVRTKLQPRLKGMTDKTLITPLDGSLLGANAFEADRLFRERIEDVREEIENDFNPDHLIGSAAWFGTAFREDNDTARFVRAFLFPSSPSLVQPRVTVFTLPDIGKTLDRHTADLKYLSNRFEEIRAHYAFDLNLMILE